MFHRYFAKADELEEITKRCDALKAEHEKLREERLDAFFAGFKIISTKLKEMYVISRILPVLHNFS